MESVVELRRGYGQKNEVIGNIIATRFMEKEKGAERLYIISCILSRLRKNKY